MSHKQSQELFDRASKSMAGGVSSQFRVSHPFPLFYKGAQGTRITDVDNNTYLDFTLSQGPVLLGHQHAAVDQAIADVLQRGILYAGQHELEFQVAEWVCRHIPSAELVRFGSCGSEMVQAALRTARSVTGRQKFMKFEGHYHGWFDNVAISIKPTPENAGPHTEPTPVPWTGGQSQYTLNEVVVAPFNQIEIVRNLIEEHADDLAAVILEPIGCNNGCIPADPEFLRFLRQICDERGIVLIFDEIITGFRTSLGGAQAYFGVTPDLSTFGKAMGAGLPIAMLVGKERFMQHIAEGKAIHAGTYNSNTVCMAAALAILNVLETEGTDQLVERGNRLMEGLRSAAAKHGIPLLIQGPGPMFHTAFTTKPAIRELRDLWDVDEALLGQFVDGMMDEGVRLINRGLWYVSLAHTDADIDEALAAADRVFARLSAASKGGSTT